MHLIFNYSSWLSSGNLLVLWMLYKFGYIMLFISMTCVIETGNTILGINFNLVTIFFISLGKVLRSSLFYETRIWKVTVSFSMKFKFSCNSFTVIHKYITLQLILYLLL